MYMFATTDPNISLEFLLLHYLTSIFPFICCCCFGSINTLALVIHRYIFINFNLLCFVQSLPYFFLNVSLQSQREYRKEDLTPLLSGFFTLNLPPSGAPYHCQWDHSFSPSLRHFAIFITVSCTSKTNRTI